MLRTILKAILAVLAVSVALSTSDCSSCRHSAGTPEATAAGGTLPGAVGEPAGPPLEVKAYNPAGKAKNQAMEFSIPGFTVTSTLGSRSAPAGKVFLVIDTVWKNIIPLSKVPKHPDKQDRTNGVGGLGLGAGQAQEKENPDDYEMKSTPYLIPDVKDHAFVLINGQDTAVISEAQSAAAHPLSVEQIVVPELNAEVRGQLVYEIPASGVSSVLFRYLDTSMGSFDVPLYGKPPAAAAPVAGPVKNEVLEVSAYGVQQVASLGGKYAPGADAYAVVQLGCTGKSEGSLVQVELENYAYLRDAQGSTFTPAKEVSVPGQFKGMVQFLPETAQRGALVFQVPAQHGALTLVIKLTGYAPLELDLPNTATGRVGGSAAANLPPVLFTISDGDTLDVQIHGVRTAPNLGDAQPEEGKRFLVLDLSLVSKVDQGIEFQTSEQLKLLNGEEEILVDTDSMEKLAHPLVEDSVVPAHGRGRFEVAFQAPANATKLVLYYRGFNREEKHPLAIK
ncbi:MAG: hypothetical protein ABSF14_15570 [Terriglobia bacterium]|jgi:hypothetical protein